MKYTEITFQTLCGAVKHQWKRFLLVALMFSLLGAGAGAWYAGRAESPSVGCADALAAVDISAVEKDAGYYSNYMAVLAVSRDEVSLYLQTIAADSTLTTVQKETLKPYFKQLKNFSQKTLPQLQTMLATPKMVYVPVEYTAALTREYTAALEQSRLNLVSATAAADIVKSMDAPDVENEASGNAYGSLLAQAAQYGEYQKSVLQYEAALNRLTNQPEQVAADSRELDRQLGAATEKLNNLAESLSRTAQKIAEENHLNLLVTRGNDEVLQITLNHTHGAASAKEAFAILTLFCVLTGICCGACVAVYREGKALAALQEKEIDASAEVSSSEEKD